MSAAVQLWLGGVAPALGAAAMSCTILAACALRWQPRASSRAMTIW
ncbi:MAG: hypothetical protein WAU56_00020 [Steroidobacteraceae bacterium]